MNARVIRRTLLGLSVLVVDALLGACSHEAVSNDSLHPTLRQAYQSALVDARAWALDPVLVHFAGGGIQPDGRTGDDPEKSYWLFTFNSVHLDQCRLVKVDHSGTNGTGCVGLYPDNAATALTHLDSIPDSPDWYANTAATPNADSDSVRCAPATTCATEDGALVVDFFSTDTSSKTMQQLELWPTYRWIGTVPLPGP